jgi:hypothetical protein
MMCMFPRRFGIMCATEGFDDEDEEEDDEEEEEDDEDGASFGTDDLRLDGLYPTGMGSWLIVSELLLA